MDAAPKIVHTIYVFAEPGGPKRSVTVEGVADDVRAFQALMQELFTASPAITDRMAAGMAAARSTDVPTPL